MGWTFKTPEESRAASLLTLFSVWAALEAARVNGPALPRVRFVVLAQHHCDPFPNGLAGSGSVLSVSFGVAASQVVKSGK